MRATSIAVSCCSCAASSWASAAISAASKRMASAAAIFAAVVMARWLSVGSQSPNAMSELRLDTRRGMMPLWRDQSEDRPWQSSRV